LIVRDGLIDSVMRDHVRDGDLPDTVIEADIVSPGMIDLQVNGAAGHEVAGGAGSIDAISRWLVQSGVTAWLPTVVTADAARYPLVFASWGAIDRETGAIPLGLHLEGPFLSPARKGAHQLRYIEAASDELFAQWLGETSIALVTLAPEREGAIERIRLLIDRGIVVSLGHTDATCEQFLSGIDAGATKATHLFNAMSPIHHRQPGAMVAALLDDRVTCGLIPDGVHAHPEMVRLALRTKGPDRIAIVSDMMSATGLGAGDYSLGGQTVTVTETTARLADGTLAGAVITMDDAVRNLVDWGVSPAEALYMATTTPAHTLGDMTRGRLVAGTRADLTLWSADLEVQHVIVGGRSA
jgi:N-acetylglucosamine-6-phosphate deacetylase